MKRNSVGFVVLVLVLSIGSWILLGSLLVWLASIAIASIEFSWALGGFVGIMLAITKGIIGAITKAKTRGKNRYYNHHL